MTPDEEQIFTAGLYFYWRSQNEPAIKGVQLASPHVPIEAVHGVTGFDPAWEACEELCYCEPTKPCPKSVQLASSGEEGK